MDDKKGFVWLSTQIRTKSNSKTPKLSLPVPSLNDICMCINRHTRYYMESEMLVRIYDKSTPPTVGGHEG